jgi:hypothetical protein
LLPGRLPGRSREIVVKRRFDSVTPLADQGFVRDTEQNFEHLGVVDAWGPIRRDIVMDNSLAHERIALRLIQ